MVYDVSVVGERPHVIPCLTLLESRIEHVKHELVIGYGLVGVFKRIHGQPPLEINWFYCTPSKRKMQHISIFILQNKIDDIWEIHYT